MGKTVMGNPKLILQEKTRDLSPIFDAQPQQYSSTSLGNQTNNQKVR